MVTGINLKLNMGLQMSQAKMLKSCGGAAAPHTQGAAAPGPTLDGVAPSSV
jgi:hypothetical protein